MTNICFEGNYQNCAHNELEATLSLLADSGTIDRLVKTCKTPKLYIKLRRFKHVHSV